MNDRGRAVSRRSALRFAALASAFAVLGTSGCATIVAGGPDMIAVTSTPDGATVYLDSVPVGRTPTTVAFQRSCEGILRFEKQGFKTMQVDESKVFNGWFLGNIIFGGLIGVGVDLVTSNQGKYSNNPIGVSLVPEDAPSH